MYVPLRLAIKCILSHARNEYLTVTNPEYFVSGEPERQVTVGAESTTTIMVN